MYKWCGVIWVAYVLSVPAVMWLSWILLSDALPGMILWLALHVPLFAFGLWQESNSSAR